MEKQEHFYTVGGNVNQFNHCGRQCGNSSRTQKQKFHLTQQSHYWRYIQRIINHSFIKTHALFTKAKTWNQPKCPLMIDWTRKTCYIHTMEYYVVIKKSKFTSIVGTWINMETIILSKLTQEQKIKHCMFSLIGGCLTMRTHGHREGSIIHQGLLVGTMAETVGGREVRER